MDPLTLLLLAGGGSIISSGIQYLGNRALQANAQDFDAQQAQLARDFASQEAATARDFSAEQAQLARDFEATKYQRTVQDMKAAGLNPAAVGLTPVNGGSPMASSAMASSSGFGASPGGSISSPNIGSILTTAFNSAMIESLRDKRFAESLAERTAYHAKLVDNKYKALNSNNKKPEWVNNYEKNFESGVTDL